MKAGQNRLRKGWRRRRFRERTNERGMFQLPAKTNLKRMEGKSWRVVALKH